MKKNYRYLAQARSKDKLIDTFVVIEGIYLGAMIGAIEAMNYRFLQDGEPHFLWVYATYPWVYKSEEVPGWYEVKITGNQQFLGKLAFKFEEYKRMFDRQQNLF